MITRARHAPPAALCAVGLLALGAGVGAAPAQAGKVEIITNPAGASCVVRQEGQNLHTVQTPATVKILTFTEGIRVTCRVAGAAPVVFELGAPDKRRRSINGDDLDQSRSRQRRRFAALRRLKKIEFDFSQNKARAVRRSTSLF